MAHTEIDRTNNGGEIFHSDPYAHDMHDMDDKRNPNLNVVMDIPQTLFYNVKRKFHDAWAFAAFAICMITCVAFGIYNIITLYKEVKDGDVIFTSDKTKHSMIFMGINLALVFALNTLAVVAFAYIPKYLIYAGILSGPIVAAVFLGIVAYQGGGMYAIVGHIAALLVALVGSFLAWWFLRGAMDIINVLLKTGTKIILTHLLSTMLVYLVFVTTSTFVVICMLFGFVSDNSGSKAIGGVITLFFFWIISFYGYKFDVFSAAVVTGALIKSTGQTNDEKNLKVTSRALGTVFWALGTIAFASLLIALIRMLKSAVQGDEDSRIHDGIAMQIVRAILVCVISVIESLIEAMNKFGLCYTVLMGTGFVDSVKGSWHCIKEGGFIALASYWAVEYGVYLINFVSVLLIFGVNWVYLKNGTQIDTAHIVMMVLFALGASMLAINFTRVITMASNALCFIFIIDRERVKKYDRELHSALNLIARK